MSMDTLVSGKVPYIIGGVVGLVTTAVIVKKLLKRPKVYNDPADTVILCTIPRGPVAPSLSPFPMKLELYLRIAKIPHKVVFDRGMSPKGKTPYIMLNGVIKSDSQFCIEYLNEKFNVDLDKNLTKEEKATARGLRKMMEESFYWCMAMDRYIYCDNLDFVKMAFGPILPWYAVQLFVKRVRKSAHIQGIGRHSKEEVREIGMGDLKALSDFLGEKPYFMGDKVTEVDCALFGMLSQCKWHLPGTVYEKGVTDVFPNLEAYLLRIREEYWNDWADCITHGGYKKAIK